MGQISLASLNGFGRFGPQFGRLGIRGNKEEWAVKRREEGEEEKGEDGRQKKKEKKTKGMFVGIFFSF